MTTEQGTILLSAGGTGGHLFPAEALAHELKARGYGVHLATDDRATKYADRFPGPMHVISSATPSGKNPFALIKAGFAMLKGIRQSRALLKQIKPRAVIGFGGYPTVPPVATASGAFPTMVHEQNAVMGRANKMLAQRVTAIAGGFLKADGPLAGRIVETGNPVRPAVLEAAKIVYEAPTGSGPIKLLVFGGSQGARYFSEVTPAALALLPEHLRQRIEITQQARPEDVDAARAAYAEIGVKAEVAPFFADLPALIASAHLVISRSGASTVSEVGVIGRPAVFVPYPHALDHDQAANAERMVAAGGALVYKQQSLPPDTLAQLLLKLLPDGTALSTMAAAAKASSRPDAVTLLADLTEAIANGKSVADFKAATA